MEIGAQFGQSDVAEAGEQKRLRFIEGTAQRGVDRLLDKTVWRLGTVADRQKSGASESLINVAQRDFRKIAGEHPAAAMALFGANEPLIAKTGHDPAHDNRMGAHSLCQNL